MAEITRFYYPEMFAAEHEIAARVSQILRSGCDAIEPSLLGTEDEDQATAIQMACQKRISILYGRPGTGKTTTFNQIVRSFDKAGLKGLIVAPSAKAAKRSSEVVNDPNKEPLQNKLECMTIHRGLEYSIQAGGFTRTPKNPLDLDYIGVDEFPMTDCQLMNDLLAAINPSRTRVILLGDPYQLPSVGPGNIGHDFIHSRVIPSIELTKIHRQGENSGIAYNAGLMLNGEMPIKADPVTGALFKDFYFVPKPSPEVTAKFIVESVKDKIPAQRGVNPVMDIQVLSPGKKSEVGTTALNKLLRDALNPGKEVYRGFRLGDKIINRKNIKEIGIVNGDVGRIIEASSKGMTVDFGAGAGLDGSGIVEFTDEKEHLGASLFLAYCYTIHSSQGSEFPVVLLPCHMSHYKLLFRNLFYTGITRAKNLSCIVGDISALRKAIETSVTDKRITGLQACLRKYAA